MALLSGRLAVCCMLTAFATAYPLRANDFVSAPAFAEPVSHEAVRGTTYLESEIAELRDQLDVMQKQYGFSDKGYAGKAACADCCGPRWVVGVEYLNWQLRRSDLDYAILTDLSALAVGVGNVERLEFDRDSGLRASLGYVTASGWEFGFGYTYFRTSATAGVGVPAPATLWATRSHPNRNEEATDAAAFGSLDYHVFDLAASRAFCVTDCASLKMFGGLRWASIDQDLRIEYDGADFDNGVVSQPVAMDAFGVRLGLDGTWHVWRGWSLFGRGAASVMYGEFHSRLLETNVSGAATIVDITDNYSHAVPVLEAAVGVSWCWNDRLEIAAGYEIASWFNVGNRSSFVDSTHEGLYNPEATDLLLDGFFLRFTAGF